MREFILLLHRHEVRYLLVGGEAVIYHGRARLTGDVDFFFDRRAPNPGRLFEALREFWEGAVPGLQDAGELAEEGLVLQFGRPPNRIDLLNKVDGLEFADAWPRRCEAVLDLGSEEVPLLYMGLDDLIRNKEASGRPRDQDDLPYLRAARK